MSPDPAAEAAPRPSSLVETSARASANMPLLGLLAMGHLVIDACQGGVPALLPFVRSALDLSYTATGGIALVANVTSSLIQPLFGWVADRSSRRWLLPASVGVACLGFALTGLAWSYALVGLFVLASGVGIAAWHPEGYRTATQVAGERKATALAIFATGGSIGIAAGPPVVTALVTAFGLGGTLGMLVPGALMAALLVLALPRLSPPAGLRPASSAGDSAPTMVRAMSLLIVVIAMRSWTQLGFTTFIPFYYIDVLGGDPRLVGTLLGVFLGGGAVGTLVAGPIADRVGVRRYVVTAFSLATPFAIALFLVSGPFALLVLGGLGFVLFSTFTMSVVLAQAYMPRNVAMSSGLIVGFALGAGGIGVTVLGWVADHWGLMTTLWISALLPAVGLPVALVLPEPHRDRMPR